ncbi:MAG: prephenate dehydratase [Rickettsiales bacterium TMED289]|nr:MAG: prephenate dehydratase [Rickettsiales bacterium TMED289]|tara:strand:+ start:1809 stop:2642 length:834 start_codon:yes stop_codon:yes gene_type:complete
MKFAYQGIPGSYSESCIIENYPKCEKVISCRTFQDAFELAKKDNTIKALVPEQNQLIGSINIETLIIKYRLNITAEHFYPINHSLLALPQANFKDIKDVYSHTAALSQTNIFLRKNNLIENVMADTAGSAAYVSKTKDITKAAIASKRSASIYGLKVLNDNIQDEKENFTRFLVFQKDVFQPEFIEKDKYITSFIFKLKNKPSALFQSLTGMSLRQVDMTKLQSFPEKGTFSSYYFFCEVQGHIAEEKISGALSDLELHCSEFQLLGVFPQSKFRNR